MASTRISQNLPPNIDPTKATLAFGRLALPRLNRELNSEVLLTRQRAVNALCDYLHDHEHIAAALREGIVESLKILIQDPDNTCRQLAIKCLYVLSMHARGRQAFLDKDVIVPLSKLFDDPEDICRLNAHMAFEMISEGFMGAQGIVNSGLIPTLIMKARDEMDEIKEFILDTLRFCCPMAPEEALNANGMEVFTQLLQHKLPSIRAKAAQDIFVISVPIVGKDRAIDCETIPALIQLLQDNSTDVRAAASGALAIITTITLGKYTAINSYAIPPLLPLVDDGSSEVRANALKCLTCLAEAPEGRKILLEHVEKIRSHIDDQVSAVSKHAQIAVDVITWKP